MRSIYNHIGLIIHTYKGELPLTHFLKAYFKKNPVLGSRDRKILSEMAYCYFRCARALQPKDVELNIKIAASVLLSSSHLPVIVKYLPEHLQSHYGKEFEEIQSHLNKEGIAFIPGHLISDKIVFSEGIKKENWFQSMLSRPKLFIRIVQKYKQDVAGLLKTAEINFEELNDVCFALQNGSPIEKIIPEKMYRVQDVSSQKTAEYFNLKENGTCWDCCSGAGGKALLVMDSEKNTKLSVSDVRSTVLDNLAARFNLYGFSIPERLQLSLSDDRETALILADRSFDNIIADVPCSGSGTWARTPEQLYFFNPESLAAFAERQKKIAKNALYYLRRGGTFTYITCSVFAAENEEVVSFLQEQYPDIILQEMQLINGIEIGADSMFIAVFRREN